MKAYQSTKHAMSYLEYHFVFGSRYGRKIFLDSELHQRFIEIVEMICQSNGFQLKGCQANESWVYLTVQTTPEISPSDALTKIRYGTSKQLRQEFKAIQHLPSLWTRKYLVSTHELPPEIVLEFLQSQKKRR